MDIRSYISSLSKQEIEKRVGNMEQLAGIRQYVLDDGLSRGVRAAEIYNLAGLKIEVLIERGMDIGNVSFCGIPISWMAPVGVVNPSYYEPIGDGFLKTFGGGLVTTCGLSSFGPSEVDNGEMLGMHGRISHLPAFNVQKAENWKDEEYILSLKGKVRESQLFGSNFLLEREIRTSMLRSGFEIIDKVTNEGFTPAEHMLLYHINIGFPLLNESTKISISSSESLPRDEIAEEDFDEHLIMGSPKPNYDEQVFYHKILADQNSMGRACVYAQSVMEGFALSIEFSADTLPYLVEWKMLGEQNYVLGLEPATSLVNGRSAERKAGRVVVLQPKQERVYRLIFSIHMEQ